MADENAGGPSNKQSGIVTKKRTGSIIIVGGGLEHHPALKAKREAPCEPKPDVAPPANPQQQPINWREFL